MVLLGGAVSMPSDVMLTRSTLVCSKYSSPNNFLRCVVPCKREHSVVRATTPCCCHRMWAVGKSLESDFIVLLISLREGVAVESINSFLIGNRHHVTIRILTPETCQ